MSASAAGRIFFSVADMMHAMMHVTGQSEPRKLRLQGLQSNLPLIDIINRGPRGPLTPAWLKLTCALPRPLRSTPNAHAHAREISFDQSRPSSGERPGGNARDVTMIHTLRNNQACLLHERQSAYYHRLALAVRATVAARGNWKLNLLPDSTRVCARDSECVH